MPEEKFSAGALRHRGRILCRGRTAGFLLLGSLPEAPSPEWLRSLDLLAQQASRLFENHRFFEDLQRFYDQTLASLMQAMQAKDEITYHHCDRTQGLVRAVAEEWSLPESLIETIEQARCCMTSARSASPTPCVEKPAALTADEYTVIKTHPVIGYRILQPLPALRAASAIVLHHQEWFNGQGYPEGPAGEEIPLGARLVTIIDAWDAMTSDRPYRRAMPKSAALAGAAKVAPAPSLIPRASKRFCGRFEKLPALVSAAASPALKKADAA